METTGWIKRGAYDVIKEALRSDVRIITAGRRSFKIAYNSKYEELVNPYIIGRG